MLYQLSAEAVLLLHVCFIAFALGGALLALRWSWILLLQVPSAAWGCFVELTDRVCPLTDVENYFWRRAGQSGYSQGFIAHYLVALVYPAGLTPRLQLALAALVVLVNAAIYGWLIHRWLSRLAN